MFKWRNWSHSLFWGDVAAFTQHRIYWAPIGIANLAERGWRDWGCNSQEKRCCRVLIFRDLCEKKRLVSYVCGSKCIRAGCLSGILQKEYTRSSRKYHCAIFLINGSIKWDFFSKLPGFHYLHFSFTLRSKFLFFRVQNVGITRKHIFQMQIPRLCLRTTKSECLEAWDSTFTFFFF